MKNYILCFLIFASIACQKEEQKSSGVDHVVTPSTSGSSAVKDEFADLKIDKDEEEEGCSTEEDIEKELMKKQKAEDFKLGGDTDCTIQ